MCSPFFGITMDFIELRIQCTNESLGRILIIDRNMGTHFINPFSQHYTYSFNLATSLIGKRAPTQGRSYGSICFLSDGFVQDVSFLFIQIYKISLSIMKLFKFIF